MEDKLSTTHLSVGVVLPDDQKLFPISKPFLTNVNVQKIPVADTDNAGGKEFVKTIKDEALMRKLREGRLQYSISRNVYISPLNISLR